MLFDPSATSGIERSASIAVNWQVFVEVEVIARMTAELRLPVRAVHEFGEALVEPEVRPVLRRLVVAEPLVGELVRNEQPVIPGPVGVCALVGKPVDELGRAHHLLAAEKSATVACAYFAQG